MGSTGWDNGPFLRGGHSKTGLDMRTVLDLLSATLRQEILRYLASTPEDTVTLEPLCDHLQEMTGMTEEKIVIRCHHVHLPKLDKASVIDYDPRMGDIRYHRDETIEHLLDEIDDLE